MIPAACAVKVKDSSVTDVVFAKAINLMTTATAV
jgi:hypothetical protein